ncbi:MAG TPA: hypothetical protein VG755_27110 [Nannocystaceae bacterium]|nr:hypothetical protein [Nannocystaceae bacterium]
MPLFDIAVMIATAIAVIGGSIAFGFAVSRKSMTALRERMAVLNAAIRGAADRLGLPCVEPPPWRHPIVGDVPAGASIRGEHLGRSLRIAVQSDEDAHELVIVLAPMRGTKWPKLGKLDASRDADRFPALASLAALAREIRVTPSELHILLAQDGAAALLAALEAALALATALDAI